MAPDEPSTPYGPVMDMLQKQLAALNTAIDVTSDRWEDLEDLRDSVMEMVPPKGSFDRRLVNKLIDLQCDLEDARDTTRQMINEMTRPFIRPLKILDLPHELLRHIFRQLGMGTTANGYFSSDPKKECRRQRVKKLRLTCRRFCENSSHLLMKRVNVELTQQSLAHLGGVSRHPKGIRCVQIQLGRHFNSDIAHNIQVFARYGAAKMRAHIELWEDRIRRPSFNSATIPYDVLRKAISRANIIAEAFEKAAQHGLEEKDQECSILQRAQECYRQNYESQLLLQRGSFAGAIISAMMCMPTATRLSILDAPTGGIYRPGRNYDTTEPKDLEDLEALRVKLQTPCPTFWWARKEFIGARSAPLDFMPGLLSSLGQAKIHIEELDMQTSLPDDLSTLSTDQLESPKQQTGQQQLRTFTFYARRTKAHHLEQIPHTTSLLSPVLHISSLQHIQIYFSLLGRGNIKPTTSMATSLLSHTWPSLKKLCFGGPFYLQDLRKLISHINNDVELRRAGYLMDGSWAEVLDFLRSCELHAATTLGELVDGAECENMSHEEIDFIFEGPLSRATKFIRRGETIDPVTAWENGDLEMPEP